LMYYQLAKSCFPDRLDMDLFQCNPDVSYIGRSTDHTHCLVHRNEKIRPLGHNPHTEFLPSHP
jgi:hypothetical protein